MCSAILFIQFARLCHDGLDPRPLRVAGSRLLLKCHTSGQRCKGTRRTTAPPLPLPATPMLPYSTVWHLPYLQGLAQQDAEAVHLQRHPHVLHQFCGAPVGRNHRKGKHVTGTVTTASALANKCPATRVSSWLNASVEPAPATHLRMRAPCLYGKARQSQVQSQRQPLRHGRLWPLFAPHAPVHELLGHQPRAEVHIEGVGSYTAQRQQQHRAGHVVGRTVRILLYGSVRQRERT